MSRLALRWLPRLWPNWKPIQTSNPNFTRIPASTKIEEETIPHYVASRYYPVRIGETFQDRYQVIGKLGYGTTSTVWLARDLSGRKYVTLKILTTSKSMGEELENELSIYQRMKQTATAHPGREAVRTLLDLFEVVGPMDTHKCLVHPPLWESMRSFLYRNPIRRLPKPVLAFVLQRVFLALDYLHTECNIIHTDIKADNIMFEIQDTTVLARFEQDELTTPCARKELDDRLIYESRDLTKPKQMGAPILCDFGSAMLGNEERTEDVQPNVYRAPEVILEAPWTYSIDIWNVGCMIWNLFEGGSLFSGHDPEHRKYRSRAHLAEMVALLGPPPASLLKCGKASKKFFSDDGKFCAGIEVPGSVGLNLRETNLHGDDRLSFLRLMDKMLQWEPEKRSSAKELANDEWVCKQLRS